jgi:PAS domain-containing protein
MFPSEADELAARLARMKKLMDDFERVSAHKGRFERHPILRTVGRGPAPEEWRSEALLESAVDLMGLAIYSWDPRTNELHWDARVKALWGLPPDASINYDVFRAGVHPEDRSMVEDAIKRCVNPDGDGVYHVEYRVIGIRDGVERRVATRGYTRFINGEPLDFVGVAAEVPPRNPLPR